MKEDYHLTLDNQDKSLTIKSDEIHIWHASSNLSPKQTERLEQTLSGGELKRAYRFVFEEDRFRFIAGRGLLRTILGRYLKKEPCQLHFNYGLNGKPELVGAESDEGLNFSVSYSNKLILYAFSLNRRIGVDIEYIRSDFADEQIVNRFFSKQEIDKFLSLSKENRIDAFFTCWTRKEAYLKVTGKGITSGMDQFAVSLLPGEPAALLSINNKPEETSDFYLEDLNMGHGYKAALAVEGSRCKIKYWQTGESEELIRLLDGLEGLSDDEAQQIVNMEGNDT